MIYFTSDQHFFDTAIMEFSNRPFATAEEMDRAIIDRFNVRTQGADEIYFLGDIFGVVKPEGPLDALRGLMREMGAERRQFYLMRGNHDELSDADYLSVGFRKVYKNFAIVNAGGREVFICHDPCMVQPKDTFAVCGHVHTLFGELWNPERRTFTCNVSVDVRDYEPVSLSEIEQLEAKCRG